MMPEELIVSNPEILGGKPCVRGTRLSVEFLLELAASGATQELASNSRCARREETSGYPTFGEVRDCAPIDRRARAAAEMQIGRAHV